MYAHKGDISTTRGKNKEKLTDANLQIKLENDFMFFWNAKLS